MLSARRESVGLFLWGEDTEDGEEGEKLRMGKMKKMGGKVGNRRRRSFDTAQQAVCNHALGFVPAQDRLRRRGGR
jgi:hypothetical protein